MNFDHFANITKPSTSTKDFIFIFTFLYFKNDIFIQWVLGLVTKIEKYFNKFAPPYMAYSQNMVKCFYGRS
jgi:hypothetical protein